MKSITLCILAIATLCASGCATTYAPDKPVSPIRQFGRDLGEVFNDGLTSGIIGAVAGGAVDKNVFGGDGLAGALVGGTLFYAAGDARNERREIERQALGTTKCTVTQNGYQRDANTFVVTSEERRCSSAANAPGFRNFPAQGTTTVYQTK